MKEKHYLGLTLLSFFGLIALFSCTTDDDSVPYGSNIEIVDITAQVSSVDSTTSDSRDYVNVDRFKITLHLNSKNPYADKYGFEPIYTQYIKRLNIYLNDPDTEERVECTNSFVVDLRQRYIDLYSPLSELIQIKKIEKSAYDLVFTNLKSIQPKSALIVEEGTVLETTVEVSIVLSDDQEFLFQLPLKLTHLN